MGIVEMVRKFPTATSIVS